MTTRSDDPPQYPIASVDNALRLLLLFRGREEIRLADAAEALGVAPSTAHRLLAMLSYHGFVRQNADTKRYRAGAALLEMGLAAVRRMDVRGHVRPLLEALAETTGETMHCGVLDGFQVRYLDAVESSKALRVGGRTGMVLPAHCSSVGKALLARLDERELRKAYPRLRLPRTTSHSVASRAQLEDLLVEVRRVGYAVNREESEEGVVAVGVALDDELGRAIAGISCAGPVSRMDPLRVTRIGEQLMEAVGRRSAPAAGISSP